MLPSARDNLRLAVRRHVLADPVLGRRAVTDPAACGHRPLAVVDIDATTVDPVTGGAIDVLDPVAVDVTVVAGADSTATADALADGGYDLVIGGRGLTTTADPVALWRHMVRVCHPDGVVVVVAASASPDPALDADATATATDTATINAAEATWHLGGAAMGALADAAGVHLVDTWVDQRGPWHHCVGVFRLAPATAPVPAGVPPLFPAAIETLQNQWPTDAPAEVEQGRGAESYVAMFTRLHRTLAPRSYLEIGVSTGLSLRLASCPSIGIDPDPHPSEPVGPHHHLVRHTSDDAFAFVDDVARAAPFDLAFIDGMHLVENVVMDFMNTERHCHPASVILVDDPCPAHPMQAERTRVTQFWTGDVWKILPIVRRWRPDLLVLVVDTHPTATLMVIGADPANTVLWDNYDVIVDAAVRDPGPVDADIVARVGAIDPADPLLERIWAMLAAARTSDDPAAAVAHVRAVVAGALPRTVVPS